MNRRDFGKLAMIGTLATLTKGIDAEAQAPDSSQRRADAFLYRPTLKSIRLHATPQWFQDAKFGMFIDYGLYSVAGYAPKLAKGAMYPDWYLYNMYHLPAVIEYHRAKWGKDFQRDGFLPLFTAKNFDPEGIAQIAEDTGMRYVIPFCKHHDGFCLWPSSYTHRTVMDYGPKRDLIGPLNDACRKRGLKFGFYFSLEEWEYPVIRDGKKILRVWTTKNDPRYEFLPYDEKTMAGMVTGKIPVHDFAREYIIPQAIEFVDRYDPDIIWYDGGWTTDVEKTGAIEITSHFYNHALGRKEVATNDRLGRLMRFNVGDFYTSEYGSHDIIRTELLHKWENCQGVSQSFGYNWQDTEANIIGIGDLIDMLVKIVSDNGNLLLVVNLDGTGAMPGYIRDRLREMGDWMRVNGEAIYGSKPWYLSHWGDRLRFTQSGDGRYLYAIQKGWPDGGEIELPYVWLDPSSRIWLLGAGQTLDWRNVAEGSDTTGKGGKVVVRVPDSLKDKFDPVRPATLKVELAG